MNTVQRYIESEKHALNTYIPIDRYVKARPDKIENHCLDYTKHKFHEINARKARSDFKTYIRPDMHLDEENQLINNHRSLSDDTANVRVPDIELKNIYPKIKKMIEQRFM